MRKLKKIKKVIVDFKKWARGGKHGTPALLNKDNYMCCLGFECRQRGLSNKDIYDNVMPSTVANNQSALIPGMTKKIIDVFAGKTFQDCLLVEKCSRVNDDPNISDLERMRQLKKVFRRRKMTIEFRNVPKNLTE